MSMEPRSSPKADLFSTYPLGAAYDEMFDRRRSSRGRTTARSSSACRASRPDEFRRRKAMTDLSMLQDGVGFTVYRQEEGIERVWPMDPVPRIIPADEWEHIEKRPGAAADRAQPVPQGRLPRPAHPPRPRASTRG